jgi:hypothetical protein
MSDQFSECGEERISSLPIRHNPERQSDAKKAKPKYGDGIEWKLKQDVDFLRDA